MRVSVVDEDPVFPPGDVGFGVSHWRAAVHHHHLLNSHLHITGLHPEVFTESWKKTRQRRSIHNQWVWDKLVHNAITVHCMKTSKLGNVPSTTHITACLNCLPTNESFDHQKQARLTITSSNDFLKQNHYHTSHSSKYSDILYTEYIVPLSSIAPSTTTYSTSQKFGHTYSFKDFSLFWLFSTL